MIEKLPLHRRIKNHLLTGACYLTSLLSVLILILILWQLVVRGIGSFNLTLLIEPTPAPGQAGGLSDAILGSTIMTSIAIIIAIPVGVLIATYLAEFGRKSQLSHIIRFINDILLSAPSIIMGLFIYALIVKTTGTFSGIAGALALALIAIPMITRTTEDVLYLVSPMLKESAVALGVPRWRVTLWIVYRSARSGIITAILLALARIAGETAPLLFTALNNGFANVNPLAPMASLPVVIFQFAMSPYQGWQNLAWAGALLITVTILLINLIARLIMRTKER